jgi:hypothetical protein
MSMALLAQAAIHQLRGRLGDPINTWDAMHLSPRFFGALHGDVRVERDTVVVTFYNASNVDALRKHYEGLPENTARRGHQPGDSVALRIQTRFPLQVAPGSAASLDGKVSNPMARKNLCSRVGMDPVVLDGFARLSIPFRGECQDAPDPSPGPRPFNLLLHVQQKVEGPATTSRVPTTFPPHLVPTLASAVTWELPPARALGEFMAPERDWREPGNTTASPSSPPSM